MKQKMQSHIIRQLSQLNTLHGVDVIVEDAIDLSIKIMKLIPENFPLTHEFFDFRASVLLIGEDHHLRPKDALAYIRCNLNSLLEVDGLTPEKIAEIILKEETGKAAAEAKKNAKRKAFPAVEIPEKQTSDDLPVVKITTAKQLSEISLAHIGLHNALPPLEKGFVTSTFARASVEQINDDIKCGKISGMLRVFNHSDLDRTYENFLSLKGMEP